MSFMFKLIKKHVLFTFCLNYKIFIFKKFYLKKDLQYENDLYQLVKEKYLFSVSIY
jgi:hypothetical protein